MKIETLKELDKLMRLCKKRGIASIKVDNIEFTIDTTQEPTTYKPVADPYNAIFDPGQVPLPYQTQEAINTPDELTEEQRMFGSSDPSVWVEQQ